MRAVKPPRDGRGGVRDVVAARAKKHDPRADPDSIPGFRAPAPPAVPREADEVDVDVEAEPRAEEAPSDERTSEVPDDERPSEVPGERRLAGVDLLIERGAWKDIRDKLAAGEAADDLPPALALVYAIARREAGGEDGGATPLAIKSMAALLGVAEDSAAALVLAKRLLRQNPVAHLARKGASTARTLGVVAVALVVGVLVGLVVHAAFPAIRLF
jgi:hypothetical protein